MKIENVKQVKLILENSEVLAFNSNDVIRMELIDESTYICCEDIPPLKLDIILSNKAKRIETRLFEIMNQVIASENEKGEIQTRNNFDRLLSKCDIERILLIWNDDEMTTLRTSYPPNGINIEDVRNCNLDQDENLHISLFVQDEIFFDGPLF